MQQNLTALNSPYGRLSIPRKFHSMKISGFTVVMDSVNTSYIMSKDRHGDLSQFKIDYKIDLRINERLGDLSQFKIDY